MKNFIKSAFSILTWIARQIKRLCIFIKDEKTNKRIKNCSITMKQYFLSAQKSVA